MNAAKRRRTRGEGSVYKKGIFYWIAYRDPAGERARESSGSKSKDAAVALLRKRNGQIENRIPVVRNAETVLFSEAAKAVISDYERNKLRSITVVTRRINKHLVPYFGGRRLANIKPTDVKAFIDHRRAQGITRKGVRVADVSNSEINRELQCMKRIFSLAIEDGLIAMQPSITLLDEPPARTGFFEPEQFASVLKHLPEEIQPVVTFAYISAWRVNEILKLEWRQVDFVRGEVRLSASETKNKTGRVFPFNDDMLALLTARKVDHDTLKARGVIVPQVFFRMVARGRGGLLYAKPITTFTKSWKNACKQAGCPGKLVHDLRRTAIRQFIRTGTTEGVAMKLSGHKTRSVFDRYNIIDDSDLREATARLNVGGVRSNLHPPANSSSRITETG